MLDEFLPRPKQDTKKSTRYLVPHFVVASFSIPGVRQGGGTNVVVFVSFVSVFWSVYVWVCLSYSLAFERDPRLVVRRACREDLTLDL